VKTTYVNGDSVVLSYDSKHNVLTKTRNPVPGVIDPLTGLPHTPITESWTYDANFSKVLTAKDSLGNVTTYEYDANSNPIKVTQPVVTKPGVASPVNPVATFTYGARGLVATATDAEGRVTSFAYDPTTFDLLSVTKDSGTGRLNLKTSYTYDSVGNKITVTDLRGNTSTIAYDGMRRAVQLTAPAPFTATITKLSYDADGRSTSAEQATGVAGSPWLTETTSYDAAGKPIIVTRTDGTTTTTQYDILGRPERITSSSGRQVRYTYDAASRVTLVTDDVSGALDPSITVNLGSVVREMRTYFPGGLLAVSYDNKANATKYSYDGFNRLKAIIYPDDTPTTPSFELYGYDANGNVRAIQTRSGAQIWSTYDALSRKVTKAPSGQATITYGYDYTGRLFTAQASTDSSAHQISYDTAGRPIGEFSPLFGWTTAKLDANGNITSLMWPSSAAFTTSYTYDELDRLTAVFQGTATTGVRIAGYTYNTLSQRKNTNYGPATAPVASTAFAYNLAGQIGGLSHTWNGSGSTLGFTYLYNNDHQRTKVTLSDATFLPSGLAPSSATYVTNNLNQYTIVNGTAYSYDKRGNLTSDGVWTYGYNTENQLISASKSGVTATYSYDPFGRRKWKTVNGMTTAWVLFGDREIAEYEGSGTIFLTRRFVYGPGIDDPIASISASNTRT
jgi:YD repeat-containing protein